MSIASFLCLRGTCLAFVERCKVLGIVGAIVAPWMVLHLWAEAIQGGAPKSYKWVIIPLTIDISPTKTIVIELDLCSPT
jgi:hypothetical protein